MMAALMKSLTVSLVGLVLVLAFVFHEDVDMMGLGNASLSKTKEEGSVALRSQADVKVKQLTKENEKLKLELGQKEDEIKSIKSIKAMSTGMNNSSSLIDISGIKDGAADVSMVVIASEQRSSSTYLACDTMAKMNCSISLNEILSPSKQQSGDGWAIEGMELFGNITTRDQVKNLDPAEIATMIIQIAQRRCAARLQWKGTKDQCNNHCWVNYKHFSIHLASHQHLLLWESMAHQLHAIGQTFSMIVLERNVKDQWKSHWFAKQTGDWNTHGSPEHKQKLEKLQVPPVEPVFGFAHQQWFALIRGFIALFNRRNQKANKPLMPFLEISFQELTSQSVEDAEALLRKNIMHRDVHKN